MKKLTALILALPAIALAHNVSSNIVIKPIDQIDVSARIKAEAKQYNFTQKNKGFVEVNNDYTQKLYLMRNKSLRYELSNDPAEKELKRSPKQVKLNFKYKDVVPNPIAYTGIGIVKDDETYRGIKTFFDGKEMGTCTLSVFNVNNFPEPMVLNQDGLKYDVGDKPTRTSIEGNGPSGYMYDVKWYDESYVRDIECANMKFNPSIINQMLKLANKIDKQF